MNIEKQYGSNYSYYGNNNNNTNMENRNYGNNGFDDDIFNALDLDQHQGINYHSICPVFDPIMHPNDDHNSYQDFDLEEGGYY